MQAPKEKKNKKQIPGCVLSPREAEGEGHSSCITKKYPLQNLKLKGLGWPPDTFTLEQLNIDNSLTGKIFGTFALIEREASKELEKVGLEGRSGREAQLPGLHPTL